MLLCRIDALRRYVVAMKQPELGGGAFAVCASGELERIMALSVSEAVIECSGIRAEMRCSLSFNLLVNNVSKIAFVPGLFRYWLRREGARLMGAESAWSQILDGTSVQQSLSPSVFILDGIAADHDIHIRIDTYDLRRGKAPLSGSWRCLTWESTLREIQRRYGSSRRVRVDGAGSSRTADINWTVDELYPCMYCKPHDVVQLNERELQLLSIYRSLSCWQDLKGRPIKNETLGRFQRQRLKKTEYFLCEDSCLSLESHRVLVGGVLCGKALACTGLEFVTITEYHC